MFDSWGNTCAMQQRPRPFSERQLTYIHKIIAICVFDVCLRSHPERE